MIRRIALTLCVAVLAGAASLPETAAAKASDSKASAQVALSAHRSGYIVASS
jgi:hypothetical protein